MATEKKIKSTYKKFHDDLSALYYDGTMGITKEDYDTQHGLIWNNMEDELAAGGYKIVRPAGILKAEIDALTKRIEALEAG
jgi:hypothetical protein